MTSLLAKVGVTSEMVYNATSYPIAWTQSFYGAATDYVVLPSTNLILDKMSWLWTKSSSAEETKELTKPSKRCLTPKSIFNVCRRIKKIVYSCAYMEETKAPHHGPDEGFEKVRDYICLKGEKICIEASRVIYFVADIGEKTAAARLYVDEMTPKIRPSLNKHFVKPVCADVKTLLIGPKIVSEQGLLAGGMQVLGDHVEKEAVALIDEYLIEREVQVFQTARKIDDAVQTQVILFSNGVFREGVCLFVTPVIVSVILSYSGVSITTGHGYLTAMNTTAFILSLLKYSTWVKPIYQLYNSYTPELTDKVKELLPISFTKETAVDPTQHIREYQVLTKHYNLINFTLNFKTMIQGKTAGIPVGNFIDVVCNSASLQRFQTYATNFAEDINAKSNRSLARYQLIDSPIVEEVDDEESSESDSMPGTPPPLPPRPESLERSEARIIVGSMVNAGLDHLTELLPTLLPPSSEGSGRAEAREIINSVVKVSLGQFTGMPASAGSIPGTPVNLSPRSEGSEEFNAADAMGKLLANKTIAALANFAPGRNSKPSISPKSSTSESSDEAKPVDDIPEEPKEIPPSNPNWIKRAALISIVAGAILLGSKILSKISTSPFFSRFSNIQILQGSTLGEFLSSTATAFLRYIRAR